jgi:hypothetical protein
MHGMETMLSSIMEVTTTKTRKKCIILESSRKLAIRFFEAYLVKRLAINIFNYNIT